MKSIILIAIAVMTLPAMAQEHRQGEKGSHKKETLWKDLTPEEAAALKTKQMTLHLDLTDAQQKQIEALLIAEETFKQEKRHARKQNQSEDKPSKEERLAMMNERLDRQIEMKQKMKSILNGDQYEKWEKAHFKKDKKRLKRHHKNKGVSGQE